MTGELGRLIQAHKDEQQYEVSNAAMAKALGVTRTTVGNWMAGGALPTPDHLRRLAALIGRPYTRVLDAALTDAGYLAKESGPRGNTTPIGAEVTFDTPDRESARHE